MPSIDPSTVLTAAQRVDVLLDASLTHEQIAAIFNLTPNQVEDLVLKGEASSVTIP